VPRHLLAAQSEAFAGMFSLPECPPELQEGDNDERPVELPPSILKKDFESLLFVLYKSRK
jgi:hypothetical protein